jgi:hypothetical protein
MRRCKVLTATLQQLHRSNKRLILYFMTHTQTHLKTVAYAIALLAIAFPFSSHALGLGANANTTISVAGNTAAIQARGNTEIDKRLTDLAQQNARIQGMKRLSDSQKATFSANIQTEISNLQTLKTKIDSETDASLKSDVQSITGNYRIYMLVMPQTRIMSAGDRGATVADLLASLSVKFQARIAAEQAAGKDVAALQASLTDMNAKIADAKIQSQAAITAVVSLTPDNKDSAKMQANETALATGRADIKATASDLKAAQQDAKSIAAGLKSLHVSASASTTTH